MPRYMLDTNMCIYLMKNQPEQVARRFAACQVGDVAMSAITYAELQHGVAASRDLAREGRNLSDLVELIPVLPFDRLAGDACGPVRMATRERKSDQEPDLGLRHAQLFVDERDDWLHRQQRHAHGDAGEPKKAQEAGGAADHGSVAAYGHRHKGRPGVADKTASAPPGKQYAAADFGPTFRQFRHVAPHGAVC